MNRIIFAIAFLLILVSCQEVQRTPKPENLISEEKMVDVLTELSLLHGARSYNRNLMEQKGIAPYPYLMEKYQIDSSQLVKSNNYYAENARQYQRIYEKVKDRLDSLLQVYDSIREVEERRLDSIRKLEPTDSLGRPIKPLDSLQIDTMRNRLPEPVSRDVTIFRKANEASDSVR